MVAEETPFGLGSVTSGRVLFTDESAVANPASGRSTRQQSTLAYYGRTVDLTCRGGHPDCTDGLPKTRQGGLSDRPRHTLGSLEEPLRIRPRVLPEDAPQTKRRYSTAAGSSLGTRIGFLRSSCGVGGPGRAGRRRKHWKPSSGFFPIPRVLRQGLLLSTPLAPRRKALPHVRSALFPCYAPAPSPKAGHPEYPA